jgi:hypothetical protein
MEGAAFRQLVSPLDQGELTFEVKARPEQDRQPKRQQPSAQDWRGCIESVEVRPPSDWELMSLRVLAEA